MDAISLFGDMFRHMVWADALVLTTVIGRSEIERDDVVLAKLRHLHLVQEVFLDVWRGSAFNPLATETLDIHALRDFALETHTGSMQYLDSLSLAALEEPLELPWATMVSEKFGFRVAGHTLAETLVQVPSHSSYHRGQVCARLRELGIDPPMTDYIAWIWQHKPAPMWP